MKIQLRLYVGVSPVTVLLFIDFSGENRRRDNCIHLFPPLQHKSSKAISPKMALQQRCGTRRIYEWLLNLIEIMQATCLVTASPAGLHT